MQPVIDLEKEYGLALEGGGAKGAYQIGAWQALEEAGVKIRGVSGTSVGALNGALICQGDLETAKMLWANISYSKIMDVDDDRMERMFQGTLKWKEALEELTKFIADRGADITPLKNLIAEHVDEEKLRNSGRELFVSTYSVTDRMQLDVDIRDMPEGYVKDLLLASAYLPVFRNEKLHGKTYLDGGVNDVIPVDALIKRGYKDIIMVRIFGVGREKRIEIPGDVNIHSIEPRVDLGNIIDFNSEKSRRNMVTGYYDAQRFLYGLAGSIYYIEQTHEQCYYLKQLTSVKQEILIGLSEEYRLDPDPDMQLRNLLEVLLPVFAGELRLSKEWSYGELYLGILEATARLLRVPKYQVYTVESLKEKVLERYREEEAELPPFSRLILNEQMK